MKRTRTPVTLLLSMLLLFTACQPTPEAEPVKQKDTDKLIEMAVATAAPESTDTPAEESASPAPTPEPIPLSQRFGERFIVDYTASTGGAKVTGDVKIRYLAQYALPMYRVKNALPEGEKVKELSKRLLEAEDVYEKTVFKSKADIKADIDSMSKHLADEKWLQMQRESEGDNFDQWLTEYQERIQSLQAQYDAMTGEEERPLLASWAGTFPEPTEEHGSNLSLVAHADDFGSVPNVSITWNTRQYPYFNLNFEKTSEDFGFGYLISEIAEDWSVPCGNAQITPQEAADKAAALFEGLWDMVPTEVRWGGNGSDTSAKTKNAYIVYLSPNYQGAGAIYTALPNTETEIANENGEGATWYRGWDHEQIRVVVDDTGIRACQWINHMEVEEVLTENANLLDFDTVYTLFTQQMNRKLAMEEEGAQTELMAVTLGLMCIREQDSPNTALMVPVWYFRHWDTRIEPETARIGQADLLPLCVLNAVDGSVISTVYGY